jgi:hypothetical protein
MTFTRSLCCQYYISDKGYFVVRPIGYNNRYITVRTRSINVYALIYTVGSVEWNGMNVLKDLCGKICRKVAVSYAF